MGRIDVWYAKVDQRLIARFVFGLRQHQSRIAAAEKREIAERVKVVKAEHVPVPAFGRFDIGYRARNLAYAKVLRIFFHCCFPCLEDAVFG